MNAITLEVLLDAAPAEDHNVIVSAYAQAMFEEYVDIQVEVIVTGERFAIYATAPDGKAASVFETLQNIKKSSKLFGYVHLSCEIDEDFLTGRTK